jgi:hypothetical protein
MLIQFIGWSALIATIAMAFRWGGLDERITAIGFFVATLASNASNASLYGHTEVGILAVDVVLLVGLIVLALRSDRFWPMYAAAFQLVAVTVHIASLAEQGNFAWAYAVALIFWSYPVMIALIAGTCLEARFRSADENFCSRLTFASRPGGRG